MENLKLLPEIINPDQRNLMFVRMDTREPMSVEEHYAGIASVVLKLKQLQNEITGIIHNIRVASSVADGITKSQLWLRTFLV